MCIRDRSVSQEKRGDLAHAFGQLGEARQAYASQVELATELMTTYGETVVALEVLAGGELRLGQTLLQQGLHDDAQPHCVHAHHLFQRLALAMPHDRRYAAALKELEAMASTVPTNSEPT